jgi:gas vesicle protein
VEDDNRLSYFFLGLGVGVAIGVLFAPQAGADTRQMIRDKADQGRDYLRRRGQELREQADEYVERGKSAIQRQRESLSAAVEAGRSAYREASRGGSEA